MTTEVRAGFRSRNSSTPPISFIGVEPGAARFRHLLLRAWIVGRHRCGIDDDAGSRRGNSGRRLRRLGYWLRPNCLGRRGCDRNRRGGRGDCRGRWRRRRRCTLRWGGDALVRRAPDEAVERSRRRDRRPTVADPPPPPPGFVAGGARRAPKPLAHRTVIALGLLDV